MNLSNLPKLKGKQREAKRIGRGVGSGKGSHTSSRGQKGQKARSGFNLPFGFEGGQVPLFRKMPKIKGFVNPHHIKRQVVNVETLNKFKEGEVTPEDFVKAGIIKNIPTYKIKILGSGKLDKKLDLKGFIYSKSALEKIEKLGGKAS